MKLRTVEKVVAPPPHHFVGDGFRVHNFIPSGIQADFARMDPFIMMDYNSKFYFSPTDQPRGVDVHPHRGFETVTIAYKGKVAHHDSAGNSGVIGEGEVQWMTAASGVLHKEYHEEQFSKTGGDFQMVQLWVNLPAKEKMSPPKYQGLTDENIPVFESADKNARVRIIAGSYEGQEGAATTFSPVHLLDISLKPGNTLPFSFPSDYNTAVLVIEGEILVNGKNTAATDHFVLLKNDGEQFNIEAKSDSKFLVLSGAPLHEPIVVHGPFVMNTKEQILEAFHDYNKGKFGVLQ